MIYFACVPASLKGRDSSVGIVSGYGLDGPGIEKKFPVGVRFFDTSRPALGPTQPPGTGSFTGAKRPERGADHPPPSSAEVKKE
jgi:hypothetical protein